MCGIAGLIGPAADPAVVHRMRDCLHHRGPDSDGSWHSSSVALGHTRLSVVDLSPAGDQPMWTPDGRWGIVYNGEVYGFRSLRDRLAGLGHDFRSNTDTEVVLHAWAEWGPAALDRIDGMFAFGVWDRCEGCLYLVRDPLGVKPLYWYSTTDGTFVFGSEVRALLASGLVKPRLELGVLPSFLSQQTAPTPWTLIEGVQMLPAGSWLQVRLEEGQAGTPKIRAYWDPLAEAARRRESQRPFDRKVALRGLRERLQAAVERQLLADVPLGAFLSGGVDSSAVVALMSEASAAPVRTFSVVFEEPGFDDGPYARLVAKRFAADHSEIRISDEELLERVPTAVAAEDHPSGDGINTWIVSQAAKQSGLTVALSGLGGDELFGGYPSFRRLSMLRRAQPVLRFLPWPARSFVGELLGRMAPGVAWEKMAELVRTDATVPEAYPVLREVFLPGQVDDLLAWGDGSRKGERPYTSRLRESIDQHDSLDLLSQVSYAEMTCYMQDVLLRDTDQMSMTHSLEVRVPFLDRELVECALALPAAARMPSSPPKRFLVQAVEHLLPKPVASRSKSGFVMPFDRWMRGPLREFCEVGLEIVAGHPAFDGDAVRQVWREFLARSRSVTWSRPWLLVAFGRWVERQGIE